MILDKYFKNPIFWDYFLASLVSGVLIYLYRKGLVCLPIIDRSVSTTSDLANVGLTLAGFILTLITVLITFKSSSKITKNNYSDTDKVFDLFFASDLYFTTIRILKNCIKSLIFVSVCGYCLKLGMSQENIGLIFFYNVFAIIIVGLTVWRCLIVLTKILQLQE